MVVGTDLDVVRGETVAPSSRLTVRKASKMPAPVSEGVTVLVATHDPNLMELADRLVELRDGHLVE